MTTTIVRKQVLASIEPGEDDEGSPTGSFHIILSTAAKDRDGEELHPQEWEQPLPDRITMDVDHGMSVASTVGSGVPTIEGGELHVRGTYASIPRAQEVRALVNEGHIDRTSVAFLRKTVTDAKGVKTPARELLNGAFVAIPANDEARVLTSKDAALKVGRRNNSEDAGKIQAIHDHAAGLGADCGSGGKALARKDGAMEADDDPGALAQGIDAVIDEALALLAGLDTTTLPEPVQQAIALFTSADATVDELLAALGMPDPDEETGGADPASASAAAAKAAAAEADAELAVRALALRAQIALSDTAQKG